MAPTVFHLAFPVSDIPSTVDFYRDRLKLQVDIIEEHRCIINMYGHQLVAHKSPQSVPKSVSMYPRHYGIILDDAKKYDDLIQNARINHVSFFKEPFVRFKETPREHRTCFLIDPSNNLIEFKWYKSPKLLFKHQ